MVMVRQKKSDRGKEKLWVMTLSLTVHVGLDGCFIRPPSKKKESDLNS